MTDRISEHVQKRLRAAAERAGIQPGPAPASNPGLINSSLIDLAGLQAYVDAHPISPVEQMKDWAINYGIEHDLAKIIRSLR